MHFFSELKRRNVYKVAKQRVEVTRDQLGLPPSNVVDVVGVRCL
jgi:hypothetical protein